MIVVEIMNNDTQKFQLALESFPRGVFVLDTKGRILFANERVNKLLNLHPERIIGRKLHELVHPKNCLQEEDECLLQLALESKTEIVNQSDVFLYGKDSEIHVEYSVYPLFEEDELTGYLVRVRREMIDEQQRHQFIAALGHEFKTPLAIISSYTHLLKKAFENRDESEFDNYAEVISQKVDLLVQLIQGMIDTITLGSGKMVFEDELLNLNDELREIVEQLQRTTRTHHLRYKGESGIRLAIDSNRLFQVISNLVTNAVKYSPEQEKIDITLEKKKGFVQIRIKDYGIGIHPEEAERIFEPFYRTSSSKESGFRGLGIGLFLSRQIVNHYQGKIWFVTEVDEGTTFYVNLPL